MASDYLLKLRFERYGPDIVDYIRGPLFKSNKAASATKEASPSATVRDFINRVGWKQRVPPMLALGMEPSRFSRCFLVSPSRARVGGFLMSPANDGHDTRAIQDYLGHRSTASTVRYTMLAPDRIKGFWRD